MNYVLTAPSGERYELTKLQMDVLFHIVNSTTGCEAAHDLAAENGIKTYEFYMSRQHVLGVLINAN